jgi:hypothetical protein
MRHVARVAYIRHMLRAPAARGARNKGYIYTFGPHCIPSDRHYEHLRSDGVKRYMGRGSDNIWVCGNLFDTWATYEYIIKLQTAKLD